MTAHITQTQHRARSCVCGGVVEEEGGGHIHIEKNKDASTG